MDDSIVIKPQTLSKGRLWTALIAILLGQFVVAIDLTVLNIALPELTRDLSPSSDQLLWVVDVYSLVLAGFLVATSSLSDRFGRKKMLLAGFLIFGIGSVLVVFINDASQLIAIRAFLGIGGAMIMPITISMIRSIFTDSKERAIAVAAWSAISAIGMAAGPLIGGVMSVFMGVVTPIEGMTTGHTMFVIAGSLLIIKGFDDFVLQPTLYSERVKAHPLEIFIVILIAGSLAGIVGMLLAIPSYTVLRVFAKEFFSQFRLVQKLTEKI